MKGLSCTWKKFTREVLHIEQLYSFAVQETSADYLPVAIKELHRSPADDHVKVLKSNTILITIGVLHSTEA